MDLLCYENGSYISLYKINKAVIRQSTEFSENKIENID